MQAEPSAKIISIDGPDAPPGSEEDIALTFAAFRAGDLRFVAPWNKWMQWDGTRWAADSTLAVFDSIRPFVRAQAERIAKDSAANALASAKTVAAVERLAKSDRRLAAELDIWDSDLLKIGTPGGTLDLRNGELAPAKPADFITRLTRVSPAPENASHPTWSAFLDYVTSGDQKFQRYLQKVAGYFLTGLTREHAVFILHGNGRNGKSIFVNTLTAIMDGYSETASMDTFVDTHGDRHPTDLAKLQFARLVTAQETERGRSWSLARLKSLSGGDPVSARYMRQDFFTYVPQFKLIIVGNHLPGIGHLDEAIRARLKVIPFSRVVPEEARDPQLLAKLEAEFPAILRWAVEGCVVWLREGLGAPPVVLDATAAYFDAEDLIEEWMTECCTTEKAALEGSTKLYQSWKRWCDQRGERPGTHTAFARDLKGRGFTGGKLPSGQKAFHGLVLKQPS